MDLTVIRNIINSDFTNIKNGKNSMISLGIIAAVFFLGTGFLISPLGGFYCPMLLGIFFVPALFQSELKYHSEKLPLLLPIRRRDLVNARFLLTVSLYCLTCLAVYVLMIISMKIKLFCWISESEEIDALKLLSERLGFSPVLFFNMVYSITFAFGLASTGNQLRTYFKDPERLKNTVDMTSLKAGKKETLGITLIFLGIVLFILCVTGIIPVATAAAVILQLISNLAHAGKGIFLTVFALCMGAMSISFSYICTRLEYEEKDLG